MKLWTATQFGLMLLALPQNVGAYSVQRTDKLTIIKFEPDDFDVSISPEDNGLYGDFVFQTPPFDLPERHDSELVIFLTFTGHWRAEFKNPHEQADYDLGVLELNYEDRFGNAQFTPKVISPRYFGVPQCENDRCSAMRGNTHGQPRTISHGPLVLKAGAKKLQVGLSDVAAHTRFELKTLELHLRPLK